MSEHPRDSSHCRGIGLAILVFSCAGRLAAEARHLPNGVPLRPLALRFEPNVGQTDPQVRFLSGSGSGDVFLTPSEIVLSLRQPEPRTGAVGKSAAVRLHILDANPNLRAVGLDPLPGRTNYFIGNDPKKWRTNVPAFARVRYTDVYPGIDLVAYGNDGTLEYDFEVSPGADPRQIAMSVEGADQVALDGGGDLVLRTALGEIRQRAPRIYQRDDTGTHEIAGGYVMRAGTVAFTLAAYDAARPLVIDPQLAFATYFGGSAETDIHALAVDAAGAIYVAGDTYAHDFPTKNPLQSTNGHGQSLSAIVSKLSPDGGSLVYSTYLGGSGDLTLDAAVGIALDSTGAAYVTGNAGSSDFPTKNAIPGVGNGIFVTKLSADGASLVYSSVLGGSAFDNPRGIVLDSSSNAYILRRHEIDRFPDGPSHAGGVRWRRLQRWLLVRHQRRRIAAALLHVHGRQQRRRHSVVGGPSDRRRLRDRPDSVERFRGQRRFPDELSCALQAGRGRNGRRNTSARGGLPLCHFKRRVLGDPYSATSYIPVEIVFYILYDLPDPEEIDLAEHPQQAQASEIEVFVSSGCVPVPPSTTCTGNAAVVVADAETFAIKSVVNLPDTIPPITAAVKDAQGAIYAVGAAGRTSAPPLVAPTQSAKGGGDDGFVMVLAPVTRAIVFSTYLGGNDDDEPNGIALDPQGNIYVAGQTQSSDFPTKNAFQPTAPAPNGASIGDGNSFIAKISSGVVQPVAREPVDPVAPRQNPTHALPPRPQD